MALQRDNRVKVSALVEVSLTTVYAIKKSMDYGEGVNRREAVVERLLWIVTACRMPFEGLLLGKAHTFQLIQFLNPLITAQGWPV